MDVNAIDTPHVETVLMQPTENDHPFWLDKHVIAYRLKGYIEEVLGYGEAVAQAGVQLRGLEGQSRPPAADPKAIHKPEPHPSLHYSEMANFIRVCARWTAWSSIVWMR